MNAFRKFLFWTHLTTGSVAGVVIFIMSATGAALAFQREILQWADRDVRSVAASGQRLSIAALLESIQQTQQRRPTSLTFRPEAEASVIANFGRGNSAYVDPYTGVVLGTGVESVHAFFRMIEGLHRAMGGSLRDSFGRAVTGYSNLLFFLIVLSGLYLWLPRKWAWQNVKPALLLRGNLLGKARNWNWHNVVGIWCWVPLVVIVGSGVVMSFPWANSLLFRAFGGEAPAQGGRPGAAGQGGEPAGRQSGGRGRPGGRENAGGDFGRPRGDAEAAPPADLDRIYANLALSEKGWTSIAIALPARDGNVRVTIDMGNGGQPQSRFDRVLSPDGSRVISEHHWADDPIAQRARAFVRFGHTGEMGGLVGQAIGAIACLAGCFLVWTGIAMALSRLRGFLRRQRASERPVETLTAP